MRIRRLVALLLCCTVIALALTGSVACENRADDRGNCRVAVDHIFEIIITKTKPFVGTPEELRAAEAEKRELARSARRLALATCEREGLSAAQRDCVLAVKDLEDMVKLGNCPAIRERDPRWLGVPPAGWEWPERSD